MRADPHTVSSSAPPVSALPRVISQRIAIAGRKSRTRSSDVLPATSFIASPGTLMAASFIRETSCFAIMPGRVAPDEARVKFRETGCNIERDDSHL